MTQDRPFERAEAVGSAADTMAREGESAVAPEASEVDSSSDPTTLRAQLDESRAKAEQYYDQLLRARAEIENLGRRHAKELENAHKFALESFVRELLQVRDSLELGHAAAQEPDAEFAKLREGTELTLKLLSDVMTKFGVVRIDPEGEPFNPDYHQAMSTQPRADLPPNTVVTVIQSGYTLNGRLVRPALAIVSRPIEPAAYCDVNA